MLDVGGLAGDVLGARLRERRVLLAALALAALIGFALARSRR